MSKKHTFLGIFFHAIRKLFSENPVFIGGLSITPVVVGATTAVNGLILGLSAAFLMLFLTFMCWFGGVVFHIPVQKGLAAFVSAAAFIPVGFLVNTYLPINSSSLGIYLPLLCVSSIVVISVPNTLSGQHPVYGFLKVMESMLGFLLCTLLVGSLREWMSAGTIFGAALPTPIKISTAAYPYMGFLFVAFLGAIAKRSARNLRSKNALYTKKWSDEDLAPVLSEEAYDNEVNS